MSTVAIHSLGILHATIFLEPALCTDLFFALYFQVGFAVVYNLLAFPRGKRKKLGQLFVVPNHQGGGVGTGLLKAVHKVAEDGEVVDVTVSIFYSISLILVFSRQHILCQICNIKRSCCVMC